MILNDAQIAKLCLQEEMIKPFHGRQISSGKISSGLSSFGYDITLSGEEFLLYQNAYYGFTSDGEPSSGIIDPKAFNPELLQAIYDVEDYFVLPPNSFVLAKTVETFKIPANVLAVFLAKSTYARCGLIPNVTPAEPGWEGVLTLELTNCTPFPIKLYVNEGICQAIFLKGERPNVTYADRKGKYQNQVNVTTPIVLKEGE